MYVRVYLFIRLLPVLARALSVADGAGSSSMEEREWRRRSASGRARKPDET